MTGIEDKIRDLVKQAGKEKRLGDKRAEQFYNSLFSGEALPIFAQLGLVDTGGDHELYLKCNENLAADRILNLIVGDAARTITLSGNPTLADWFDQSVKTTASPDFVNLKLTGAGIRQVYRDVDNQALYLLGSTATTHGAALLLYGEDHATLPGSVYLISGSHDGSPASEINLGYRNAGTYQPIMVLGSDRHIDIWDWVDSVMREISFGADDSGGAGYKVLRVPN